MDVQQVAARFVMLIQTRLEPCHNAITTHSVLETLPTDLAEDNAQAFKKIAIRPPRREPLKRSLRLSDIDMFLTNSEVSDLNETSLDELF